MVVVPAKKRLAMAGAIPPGISVSFTWIVTSSLGRCRNPPIGIWVSSLVAVLPMQFTATSTDPDGNQAVNVPAAMAKAPTNRLAIALLSRSMVTRKPRPGKSEPGRRLVRGKGVTPFTKGYSPPAEG